MIKASEGKLLKLKLNNEIREEFSLGNQIILLDGVPTKVDVKRSDIIEVTPLKVEDDIVYIESTNYSNLVSELIRLKYSIDDEMALYANSMIKDNSKDLEKYQEWRAFCKKTAKDFLNE